MYGWAWSDVCLLNIGVLFFSAAIRTLCSEWLHIDRLRLDKFYMVMQWVLSFDLKYVQLVTVLELLIIHF